MVLNIIGKKAFWGAVILLPLFAKPMPALADPAGDALKSLLNLKTLSECCITRRGYLKAYGETEAKVRNFRRSRQADIHPDLAGAINKVMRHYETVARLYRRKVKGFICEGPLLARLQAEYPASAKDFDKGGAMMRGPVGKGCMATALLVPFIFKRAAKELEASQEIFKKYQKTPPPSGARPPDAGQPAGSRHE